MILISVLVRPLVLLDLNSWMQVYGYSTKSMLGSAYLHDMVQQPMTQISSPQLAPDFGLMSGLQCIVEKVRDRPPSAS